MSREKRIIRVLLLIALGLLLVAAGALYMIRQSGRAPKELQVLGTVPEFRFAECRGGQVSSEHLLGKITVMDFIFTRCKSACPVMSGKMLQLYNLFRGTDRVQFISISVDPEYDTPEVLRAYADKLGVTDTRWLFLRGPIEDVKKLAEEGFKLSGELPGMHSTKLILIDEQGRIRGYYDPYDNLSIHKLKMHIRQMLAGMP
ncbi:MAG: SCO family protein [candidate division KSB1 bacterium]|nr:SCO family protein [candidate division KSB1 bacterium]MDQ7062807.1 SCO family protein [candidate division KSB1 bacterium]